jgi:hypothetical protein
MPYSDALAWLDLDPEFVLAIGGGYLEPGAVFLELLFPEIPSEEV